MPTTIIFPFPYFQRALSMLAAAPLHKLFCPVSRYESARNICYLARGWEPAVLSAGVAGDYIVLGTTHQAMAVADWMLLVPQGAAGEIVLQAGSGAWWGAVIPKGDLLPLEQIALIGPSLPRLLATEFPNREPITSKPQEADPATRRQFSRTIGALGQATWNRLRSLTFAIIGCGRSGSVAAVTLARLGVRQFILIDPDLVEPHNLPEMDGVSLKNVGNYKVDAVATFLRDHCAANGDSLHIATCCAVLPDAYRHALAADVLVCCVDNNAGRLACGIVAALYHKVLLDIGTGILAADERPTAPTNSTSLIPGAKRQTGLPATPIVYAIPNARPGLLRLLGLANFAFARRANFVRNAQTIYQPYLSAKTTGMGDRYWSEQSPRRRAKNLPGIYDIAHYLSQFWPQTTFGRPMPGTPASRGDCRRTPFGTAGSRRNSICAGCPPRLRIRRITGLRIVP